MLYSKYILENKQKVIEKLKTRNFDTSIVEKIFEILKNKNSIMTEVQNLENQRNRISAMIGKFVREKKDTSELKNNVLTINKTINDLNTTLNNLNVEFNSLNYLIPNLPDDSVPIGNSEDDNVILETFDQLGRKLVKAQKPHYEIGVELDILDFKRAVKMSGSRFAIFKNEGSQLVRALISFMLDNHIANDYVEITTQTLVSTNTMYGTGQLPKFHEDLFKIENYDLWLIPTAEVTLTNFHNDEILDLSKPKKYVGYTKCFRAESGSGGKDTKGLIRSHEFHKVELVKITNANDAEEEFNKTVKDAENILQKLEIPYRKILLSTGDLGFSSKKTIDLELWLPSEQRFREVSSISYFGDFQARRAKIRYKENNKNHYAHTINGSGLAIDRVFAAILEQYQNENGTITIPKVLVPYMNNKKEIK
ncbi:serine--tRNA ligase [Mesomycoplasma neurolyticum]|uniref:Serine--tRNA ligase n=1 Tax=Mesomycoplasma neurolyticum TaxID=2120 RepID=A0A449A5S2_9BACT|nr:serine--tRNA ligase [Mesomycoplasma neurolyticum]VEU59572.1 seryl-tRNA synthetase [Mesomycoplasma neurolyticum]